ncbi:glycogen synthase [Aquimarina gracilis]|uniref:Glycogen synthase n=1 Tax=Aquimarina gracilis TaxID=874422 RepID=A0ABU5ZX18_9FLAO|nr:glycogen synthase [Aquimarina gracilis]MEB3346387.1 glycogen synthase [Aquimarina gracilis]
MNILHISVECYPIAKVGGLADVVGALPKYQTSLGHDVSVILPFHDNEFTESASLEKIYKGNVQLGDCIHSYSIHKLITPYLGFTVYMVRIPRLLDRTMVYGHQDETERFVTFQKVVLNWLSSEKIKMDIIHCHDHHTGLIPFMTTHTEAYIDLQNTPTVFTIHNAQYQGQISYDNLYYLPSFDRKKIGLIDWDHRINPLATGIKNAWKVTTVSPNYMKELQESANGLENLLRNENKKCVGILNGIDTETWDPETDPMLIKNYKISTLVSGRKANKKWLCDNFDLSIEKPLFAFIGRLVGEKGADLLPDIIEESLGNTDINFLILGSGNQETEEKLRSLRERFMDRYHVHIGYDEQLSHIIYGGADFLLMPSRVEPCGLNQMYALRYGTIPIVRRTGGLKDTVIDIGDGGFGICHDQSLVWDVCYSIKRAIALYQDQTAYKRLQRQIMKIDHSWNRSAQEYLDLYNSLIQLK